MKTALDFVSRSVALGLGIVLSLAAWPLRLPAEPATQLQYLSGHGADDAVEWDFFCTAGRNRGVWSKIHVPSCWEQEGFGKYNYGVRFFGRKGINNPELATEQGKYRTSFPVPAEWQGRTVRLVFDGAMTDTEVWVNGQSAGPVHQGGFYRFKYDVTPLLKFGAANLLEVTVSKESSNPTVNLAERRGDYWNFGGIFRPVFLEALPAQFIDRTAIDARADGQFSAEVHLGGKLGAGAKIVGQIEKLDGTPVGASFSAVVPAGATQATVRTKLDGIQLWTAETPNLYQVRFTLSATGGTAPGYSERHALAARFGFRTFEVRPGDGLYLNGQKITLKGINRHSFRPESARTLSRRLNYDDVRLLKEMNMNAVRMSHYPPDPDFLEACDELGLYVLDELCGWHGKYDTSVGRNLIAEMIQRDVNHPSILFWDNGNETGWNVEIDDEFAKWDPQHRPVLHPLGVFSGIATMHYRSYAETQKFCAGPDIFMPTEFLHGLFDGGHGAGLWDYWEVMRQSPLCAGGFLWVYADEGVARADENGRIDNAGDMAPDGIVGPHHEKEGSFNTVREVWSPVQVGPSRLQDDFRGGLTVENRFDFVDLSQCRFAWELGRFPAPSAMEFGHAVIARGEITGPAVAPHAAGKLQLPLPENWRAADVLYVTAKDPAGQALWTWSWSLKTNADLFRFPGAPATSAKVLARDDGTQLAMSVGALDVRFDKENGELTEVYLSGNPVSLGKGPRFFAARRADRNADGTVEAKVAKGVDRTYTDISGSSVFASLTSRTEGDDAIIEATYTGNLRRACWRLSPNGVVRLDYEYAYDGVVDLMGINFDYPEANMKSVRWLGMGPYRVWQNRLHGTTLDVWQNAYNDTVPGESFVYPEFKGYFRGWRWATFETTEGRMTLATDKAESYLGIYTPKDGKTALLYTLPPSGLAIFDVIPAVRNKVNATDLVGPSSQAKRVSGPQRGTIYFRFAPR